MKKKSKDTITKESLISKFRFEIFLVFICLLFYGSSVNNGYSLDDDFVTNNNLMVKGGISALPEIFSSRYATEGKFNYEYRPIVKATYAIEYELAGTSPALSHLVNVILYSLAVVLLFRFFRTFFEAHGVWFAFLTTLLFAINPVHSEAVLSLKNRDGLLSLLFFIITLHHSLLYIRDGNIRHLLIAVTAYFAGVLSKMDILSLLALVPFTAYFLREKSVKRIALMFSGLGVVNLFFVFINRVLLDEGFREMAYYENPLFGDHTFIQRIGAAVISFWFYVKMAFLPYPLKFYYGFNEIDVNVLETVTGYILLAGAVAILTLTIRGVVKKELWSFAAGWFLITIAMFLNLAVPVVGIVGERFLLLPSIGTSILLVLLIIKMQKIQQMKMSVPDYRTSVILVVICLISLGQVYSRTKDWDSLYTLTSSDISKLKNSAKANDLYALACSQEALIIKDPGEKKRLVDESIRGYERAIEIYPGFISAYNNVGSVYVNMRGEYSKGIPYFEKALLLDTGYLQAKANLAFCLQKTGKVEEAENMYREVVSRDTGRYLNAFFNLGELYFSQGKFDDAIALNMKASVLFPKADLPWVTMGNYYLQKKDTQMAVEKWMKALEVYPQNEKLARNLSMYFYSRKDQEKADFYREMAETASPVK